MDRNRIDRFLAAAALAVGLPITGAHADDWPQFRHDERRSAASSDRLQLPLTDLWSAPGFGLVTWKGLAFYVGNVGVRAALVCVDVRTGAVRWRRPLSNRWRHPGIQDSRGPVAVSPDGVVFVQDGYVGQTSQATFIGDSRPSAVGLRRTDNLSVLAFRAVDGAPLARSPSTTDGNPIPQLLLYDGPGGGARRPGPRESHSLGALLLQGNTVTASSLFDLLWSWSPGRPVSVFSVAHAYPRQPMVRQFTSGEPILPEIVRGVQNGWVPAAIGNGIVVGAGFGPNFSALQCQTLALFAGDQCVWHRDYPWGLGIPSVDQGLILAGGGGNRSLNAIIAHESASGAIRWAYAPEGLKSDAVGQFSGAAIASATTGTRMAAGSARVDTADAGSHQTSPGLAVKGGRVYGVAAGAVVALEVKTGKLLWSKPLGARETVASLVASPEHLLLATHSAVGKERVERITALKLDSGKASWTIRLPQSGALALSDGLLFSTDADIHCLAPAERIFRVAVDSPRREDYDPVQDSPAEAVAAAEETAKRSPAMADASLLRLHWGEPPEELVRKAKERRALNSAIPLLISLDWLDATRSSIRGNQPAWDARHTAAFVRLCERLAAEVQPEHFDVAPEVNVYLARGPRRLEEVRSLVKAARAAIVQACPTTKVLVSFNREVMAGYGPGKFLPFGQVAVPRRSQQAELLTLFDTVDEVGLTSCPQSAFATPSDIPGDYLLRLKPLFKGRPLLITGLTAVYDPESKMAEAEQASYLRHLVQSCYWLQALLVAYPDAARTEMVRAPVPDLALRAGDKDRLGLAMWRDTFTWRRVTQLSAAAANLDAPAH